MPDYADMSYVCGIQLALDCKNLGESIFVKDSVAIALEYFYRNLKLETERLWKEVLFVHMGHISTTFFYVIYKGVCSFYG